jgi:hypothetical protein
MSTFLLAIVCVANWSRQAHGTESANYADGEATQFGRGIERVKPLISMS